ncbi:3-demethylubiquinone-9 3-O-methyltransferase [Exophiala oligosperma]|uniref:Ubiquinone biosynthesis O-methyltransferase, mitochondrial n=2 Tax=Chaetothyriales TaxID=34395 RepID=A0A0D2ELH2_9EURO|nr:3-demethylubiquinone-9 3-O-methyltransferase [Exophiala oligosperma]KAJ9628254.1 Hexaprenyldihydroxybenzoate methyltransferase, mitochondrial [Knufia peltigerae]KIW48729.1 3-demethylubiquinone-9 3-O-methyltransferase [Exophiala oligosperma]
MSRSVSRLATQLACEPVDAFSRTLFRNAHSRQWLKRGGSIQPHNRNHSTTHSPPVSSSSVSADEVSHFSRLASTWWDPHGPSRLLHLMNPLRHDFIKPCLSPTTSTPTTPDQKYTYLDIGCGGGIFASSAARLPSTRSVTAIDPTPLVIEVAKSHQRSDPALSPPKLTYLNCAIEDLSRHVSPEQEQEQERRQLYDFITVFEVLEHISQPSAFLDVASAHLKPGGWLIGSTISRSTTAWLTTKVIAEAPLVGIVPAGTHDWDQYINPDELRGYFESRSGWTDFHTQGVVYVPALGWKSVQGSEEFGNYFFRVKKSGLIQ